MMTDEKELTLEEQWEHFKTTHKKEYPNEEEEKLRFSIFQENLKKITDHNKKYESGETTFRMAVNGLADKRPSELPGSRGILRPK